MKPVRSRRTAAGSPARAADSSWPVADARFRRAPARLPSRRKSSRSARRLYCGRSPSRWMARARRHRSHGQSGPAPSPWPFPNRRCESRSARGRRRCSAHPAPRAARCSRSRSRIPVICTWLSSVACACCPFTHFLAIPLSHISITGISSSGFQRFSQIVPAHGLPKSRTARFTPSKTSLPICIKSSFYAKARFT